MVYNSKKNYISKCIDAYASYILLIHYEHISVIIGMDVVLFYYSRSEESEKWENNEKREENEIEGKYIERKKRCNNDVLLLLLKLPYNYSVAATVNA